LGATASQSAGPGNDVPSHTLRHTASTWLMQAGVDIFKAAGYPDMTTQTLENIYSPLTSRARRRTVLHAVTVTKLLRSNRQAMGKIA